MTKNLKVTVWVLVLLGYQSVYGQFTQRPIAHTLSKSSNTNQRVLETSDTLSIPFIDDFSQSNYTVDSTLWDIDFSDNVFVNSSIGVLPPTLNVATFDGWDGSGNPHDTENDISQLRTDSLISKPIDLFDLDADDSVVLSFYWQQQGFGETPEQEDELILEFLSKDNVWIPQVEGSIVSLEANKNMPFQKKSIRIQDDDYLHEGFQFKFVSVSNPKGPFDAWHIDYIKLDSMVDFTNDIINDLAISTYPTSIFNTYTMIPIEHFFAYPDTIMSEFYYDATNFFEAEIGNPITDYRLIEEVTQEVIATDSINSKPYRPLEPIFDQEGYSYLAIDYGIFSPYSSYDSLYLTLEIALRDGDDYKADVEGDDINLINDTVRVEFNIHNTLAYDDGSAEYVAGINQSSGELAVQFFTPVVDTLTHVDINFPVIYPLPDESSIQLIILDDLSDEESSILALDQFSIAYPDSINDFFRYTLSNPVIVNGEFYISMKQFTNDYIGIGLDKNTQSASKIFYKTETEWTQNDSTNVSGSLMLRAIFSNAIIIPDSVLTTKNTLVDLIEIYPNPANEQVTISGPFDSYSLFNLSGSKILDGNQPTISTREIPEGIYLMKIISNGQALNKRLLIRH